MAQNIRDLVEASVQENDNLLAVMEDIRTFLDIDTANAGWLDLLGTMVGETPRIWNGVKPDVADVEYRERIKVRIELNGGFGTMEDVLRAIRRFALLDHDSGYWDDVKNSPVKVRSQWANIIAEVSGGNEDTVKNVKEYVAAGVGLQILDVTTNVFTLGDNDGNVSDPDNSGGLGTYNDPAVGGGLAGLIL